MHHISYGFLWHTCRGFFVDVTTFGCNSLVEYSFLVKKIKFNIQYIPIVKMISALFVHLFFVAFLFVMYCVYRYKFEFFIDYISTTKPVLEKYKEILASYKNYGVLFVYSAVENATVPYSGSDILKRIKDNKKVLLMF